MEIYIEYLFTENFITGMIILILTGRFAGIKREKLRIIAGAACCGVYSFILFVYVPWALGVIFKLVFSAMVVWISFPPIEGKKVFAKVVLIFYMISFLMGGITMGCLYIWSRRGMGSNGIFYIGDITYLKITAGVVITYGVAEVTIRFLKEGFFAEKLSVAVIIYLGDKSWNVKGLIDTGNTLREPISGLPVAVMEKGCAEKILEDKSLKIKGCLVPYKSLGHRGVMEGFFVDRMVAGDADMGKMVIAVSGEKVKGGEEGWDILLHRDSIKR